MRLGFLSAGTAGLATFVAISASAIPVTYNFSLGQVTLTASVAGNPVAGPVTVNLTGTKVVVDEGALSLTNITFAIGSTPNIPISPSYLGFNNIHIDFATLTANAGSLVLNDPGPPKEYGYTIASVVVSGQFDATNIVPSSSINNAPFSFTNGVTTGTIFVDPVLGQLDLDGITLAQLDPDGPGGNPPLVLKGDFSFSGLTPEPGTALLVGLGLVSLAGARGRRIGGVRR